MSEAPRFTSFLGAQTPHSTRGSTQRGLMTPPPSDHYSAPILTLCGQKHYCIPRPCFSLNSSKTHSCFPLLPPLFLPYLFLSSFMSFFHPVPPPFLCSISFCSSSATPCPARLYLLTCSLFLFLSFFRSFLFSCCLLFSTSSSSFEFPP